MGFDRAFAVALVISLVFHLSMVTVFSIVIFFPRHDISYYDFEIVEVPPSLPEAAFRGELLRSPSPEKLLEGGYDSLFGKPSGGTDWASLPRIELPELRFAELELLRTREQGLALRSKYEELFSQKPADSWARLGQELGELGGALTQLAPSLISGLGEEEKAPLPVSRHAAGFNIYVEWLSEPKDRQLIFAPPIEALWRVRPADLDQPITLGFEVNPEGKVVGPVVYGVEDEAGLRRSAAKALRNFRFVPLGPEFSGGNQRGTLIITPAPEQP